MSRKLTLITDPVAAAELAARREFAEIAQRIEVSKRDEMLELVMRMVARIEAKIDALAAKHAPPTQASDPLVDAKFIAGDLGISRAAASKLIYKIGQVRVGVKGGALRCRQSELERYKADPAGYEPRVLRSAA